MAQANVVNTLIVPAASKVAPYYDDFDESKNFHRVMFRPGYAVQARELTQLQTILQNQVERFGRHIFENGSSVIGGKLDITDVITLNVVSQYENVDIDIDSFKDKTISYSSGNNEVIARVVQVSQGTDVSPPCLHVKYITGSEFGPGATIRAANTQLYANLVSTSNVSSNGSIAFIYDSIYFMQGHFVKVPAQATVLAKHNRQANVNVGLQLTDDIITEFNDSSLLDPAQESSNYQAPGAARYKLDLSLATRELGSVDDEKWIQVATLKNGIIRQLQSRPIYSEIEEVLARRTYDESGNYIVKPFSLRVEESSVDSANSFMLSISPGKAYVFGYESENQYTTEIEIPAARNTVSRNNRSIRVNYGNYVIVDNLIGNFNTSGQGIIDLHCVERGGISTSSNAAYQSTKIGTARIRDLNFFGGGANASNTLVRQYELYFYDNKFRTITGNAIATSSNTSRINLASSLSSVDDAYTGAYIKITSGPASGDLRLISNYNGASKYAVVTSPFSAETTNASNYELRFDITDVDSFFQTSLYTPGATSNAGATIYISNKDDATLNGNTFISEATFGDSFFSYPESFIAPGIANTEYVYRRVYNSVNFSSGNGTITSATNETFEGETTTSNTSQSIMDNFLVIVTNGTGSSRTTGDQVKVVATVNSTTPETCRLFTGNTTESFTATVYSKMKVTDSPSRVKTLVKANTLFFSEVPATATFTNGSTNTYVYLSTGHVVIENPISNGSMSLYISDVISTPKIYSAPVIPTLGQSIRGSTDVTDRFTLDRGQKSEYYDHASIRLKPGYSLPQGGKLIVCTRYYSHTSDSGYFSVDSYPNTSSIVLEDNYSIGTGYSLIPVVNGFRNADAIDFRPSRPNASNNEGFTFTSARIPIATTDFRSNYQYYIERKDVVVLTTNDQLRLIQGDSTGRFYPSTPSDSLLLHKLRVLPYTFSTRDIIVESLEHRRYTMADIGKIDRRLKNVEYYVQLNTLEKSADDLVILDVDGLDRTKYGIFVDDFSSHILADTTSPDYSCAVDVNGTFSPTSGVLMPRTLTNYIDLVANTSTSSGLSVFDDKIMLSFTSAPAITQNAATKSIPLSEYLYADFRGQIITLPEQDIWKDTTTLPPDVLSIPEPTINFDIDVTNTTNIENNDYTDITDITNIKNITEEIDNTVTIINDNKNYTTVVNVTNVTVNVTNVFTTVVNVTNVFVSQNVTNVFLTNINNTYIVQTNVFVTNVSNTYVYQTNVFVTNVTVNLTNIFINNITNTSVFITNVTNIYVTNVTNNITVVNPSPPPPPPPPREEPPILVEKLLPLVGGGPLGIGSLRWRSTQTFSGHPSLEQLWQTGYFYSDMPGPGDLTPQGRLNTLGLSNQQLYSLVIRHIDGTGFFYKSSQLGVSFDLVMSVYRFYDAILNRPPDFPGLCYWCMVRGILKWDMQTLREEMTIAAAINTELSSAFDPSTTMVITPIKTLGPNENASLIGGRPTRFSVDVGNYETMTTPEGRVVLAARTSETLVNEFYNTFLGRNGEAEGMAYWQKAFTDWTREFGREKASRLLAEGFKKSAERASLGGGSSGGGDGSGFDNTFFD